MPRKPDRFERRLRARMSKYYWLEQIASFSLDDCGMSGTEVVKELRKEHRWMERMITKEKRDLTLLAFKTRQSNDPRDIALADCLYARVHQCEEFIRWLQQRRK